MSPMAKMRGSLVSNFAVSTGIEILLEIEAPIGDGPELHGQAEEGQHDLDRLLEGGAVGALDRDRGELAPLPVQLRHLTELEVDVATLDQREHLVHRVGRGAELGAAVNERERLGDGLKIQRPVERASRRRRR